MFPAEDKLKLIAKAQHGDRGAFDELAADYSGRLALLIDAELGESLRSKVEVEDLLQETLLQAFRSLWQFRGTSEGAFRHWLETIARHVIQGQARRYHAKKAGFDKVVSLDEKLQGSSESLGSSLVTQAETGSKVLERSERFERLKKAMEALSPRHREVIQLTRLDGRSVKETARLMGCSEKALSMLLVRAMLKLRAAFGDTSSFHLPERRLDEKGEEHGLR